MAHNKVRRLPNMSSSGEECCVLSGGNSPSTMRPKCWQERAEVVYQAEQQQSPHRWSGMLHSGTRQTQDEHHHSAWDSPHNMEECSPSQSEVLHPLARVSLPPGVTLTVFSCRIFTDKSADIRNMYNCDSKPKRHSAHRLGGVNVIDDGQAAAEGSPHMPNVISGHLLQARMPILCRTLALTHSAKWLYLQRSCELLFQPSNVQLFQLQEAETAVLMLH